MDEKSFHTLAAAIARALGGTVTRKNEPHNWYFADFTTAEGLPLEVCNQDYRTNKKLSVKVVMPVKGESACRYIARDLYSADEWQSNDTVSEIGVSADKGAERIAADIRRRLIPSATDMYARACKRRDADKAFRDGKAATVARLRKALKCEERGKHASADGDMVYASGCYMQVSSANSVQLERMYVTPETALKIHALLLADKGGE